MTTPKFSEHISKAKAVSKSWASRALAWAKIHKAASAGIIIVTLLVGHYGYGKVFAASTPTQYAIGEVTRGSLISSISGTGQVESSSQVDIKPKVSGEITQVSVVVGQKVNQGDVLYRIDSTDAQKAVRDAETNLTSAQLALSKLENGVTSDSDRRTLDLQVLAKLPTIYSDIFPVMNGTQNVLLAKDLLADGSTNNIHYYVSTGSFYDKSLTGSADTIESNLAQAKTLYASAYAEYQALTPNSSSAAIEKASVDAAAFVGKLAEVLKASSDVVKLFNDKMTIDNWHPSDPTRVASDLTTLSGYLTTTNTDLATVESLNTQLDTLTRNVTSNDLDERSQALTLQQREDALLDAQNALADYTVRAPFDGIVATVTAKRGDTASSGTSGITLISPDKIATISLNEIDVAKVKAGEKATLTFDAVPDATFTGTVSSVDVLGTASQGVVNYSVKISLDADDARIKPGMSISAAIITDSKTDVLMVPTSAVKSDANGSYVQVIPSATTNTVDATGVTPQRVAVEVGDSNDSDTEITSGLAEGDKIVTRTITTATKTTTTAAPSLFGGARTGGNATFRTGGGGGVRIGG